jgi:protein O-mannosyl-transferase
MRRTKAPREAQQSIHSRWIAFAALSFITLIAYWNSLRVPFVFDDLVSVQGSDAVRFQEFNWNVLAPRAVLYLTFTLNSIWTGQDAWSYHLVNVLMHLLNGLFIFMLAERIFRHVESNLDRCRLYAGIAAAFFLVHPVQTESVTYVSSRSELLSTIFYLTGLLVYVFWPGQRIGFLCSFAVAILYVLGLGSKETVITLPATIFLYDFLFLSKAQFRPLWSRWRFYLTYLLGASFVTYYLLTVALKGSVGGGLVGHLTPWHYFLTELRVIVRYIRLIFVPVGLNLDYDFTSSLSPFEPAVIASFLFLCSLAFVGWLLRRRSPVFAFSIFWFFITLAPTSSVVPILDVIFEHRLYLPLVGVCLSFPILVELIYRKVRERLWFPGTAFRYSCIVVIALAAGTVARNYVWGDEVRLFNDVVSKSPGKDRALNNLAWSYYKRADYTSAIAVLEKGLNAPSGKMADVYDLLGNMYVKTGQHDRAIELFKKTALILKGERQAIEYNNLGTVYLYKWNELQAHRGELSPGEFAIRNEQILEPAARAFLKALEITDMPGALDSYINVMSYRGRAAEIEGPAVQRLKQHETLADLYTVGKIAFNSGDYAKASEYFERAEQAASDFKLLFFNHGYALHQLKQDDLAIAKYNTAIRIDPIFLEAHQNVGLIYMRNNDYAKAAEAFAEVLRQDPKNIISNLNLATIYMSRGDKAQARVSLQNVLEASPGNQQAANMLAQLGS